jgi:predicted nucleic acid-binding protein
MGAAAEAIHMIVIADAGPLLHLFWVDALAWALPPQEILVVEAVWREVERYAPEALQDNRLRRIPDTVPIPLSLANRWLDAGEEAALAYALAQTANVELLLLCDDRQARRVCQELSLPVTGTLGLIVAAYRLGRVSREEATAALEDLPLRGRFYVKPDLITRTLAALDTEITPEGEAR